MPPIEDLPGDFFTPTSDEVRDEYQKHYKLQKPDALIGEKTTPYVEGSATAAAVMPLYANTQTLARSVDYDDATRAQLTSECVRIGIPEPFPAIGATGYVKISASSGGGTIFAGDEIKYEALNLRFRCLVRATYFNGEQVPVIGFDTGPRTNLAPGLELKWTSPRPGINSVATIVSQGNGKGLTGGREQETEDEIAARLRSAKADPPAAGNDAEIRRFVTETPGVPVQEVFTIACSDGPGTTCYAFTLAASTAGASRAPSAAQIALTRAYLIGRLPKDDGPIDCLIIEVPTEVQYKVDWLSNAAGWVDSVTWPPYNSLTSPAVLIAVDALNFTIDTTTQPQVGQSFAFFDAVSKTFKKKRVLSSVVNGGGGYDIVCDTANGASDQAFSPVVGDIACPYSESLDLLVAETLKAFDGLGPSEMFGSFFDPGFRQKRSPADPKTWPSTLMTKAFNGVSNLAAVANFLVVKPSLPSATATGTPNVSLNLQVLGKFAVFPLS